MIREKVKSVRHNNVSSINVGAYFSLKVSLQFMETTAHQGRVLFSSSSPEEAFMDKTEGTTKSQVKSRHRAAMTVLLKTSSFDDEQAPFLFFFSPDEGANKSDRANL